MGVWKKLNSQDAFVTSYVAKKQWSPSKDEVEGLGIRFLPANNTFTETDCKFKVINCSFELQSLALDCNFILQAANSCEFVLQAVSSALDCTLQLSAQLINISPTPTATLTSTPTVTNTNTPTPTATVDCTLNLSALPSN